LAHGSGAAQLSRSGVRLLALLFLAVKRLALVHALEHVHAAPQTKKPACPGGFSSCHLRRKRKIPDYWSGWVFFAFLVMFTQNMIFTC
jgi:hypothetical protein